MYLLTLNQRQDNGAYAVLNRYGEKVLFMFEEEDDAERYKLMLETDEDSEMNVIEIDEKNYKSADDLRPILLNKLSECKVTPEMALSFLKKEVSNR